MLLLSAKRLRTRARLLWFLLIAWRFGVIWPKSCQNSVLIIVSIDNLKRPLPIPCMFNWLKPIFIIPAFFGNIWRIHVQSKHLIPRIRWFNHLTRFIQWFICFNNLLVLSWKSIYLFLTLCRNCHIDIFIWFIQEHAWLFQSTEALRVLIVSLYGCVRRIYHFRLGRRLFQLVLLNSVEWWIYFVALDRILLWLYGIGHTRFWVFTFFPCFWN